jgi:hypothetical protein
MGRPANLYGPQDRVDVVLTNPPFGGTEEPGIEQGFPSDVRTKETADLFLVLIKHINHYLANKAAVRQQVADDAGITVDQAKMVLVALLYGAKLSAGLKSAIASAIGFEAAERLVKLSSITALHDEIKRISKRVLSECPRTSRGWVINAFGKSADPNKLTDPQLFAHLLQGVEAKALQAALQCYPNDIVLVQHDGFASKSRLDVGVLAAAVREATGYDLTYEEQQLKPDPLAYFRHRL